MKQKNIAFIPVRGGSKSIPLKNVKMMNGHPLVYWSIKAAEACRLVEDIYVSTDSGTISGAVSEIKHELGLNDRLHIVSRSAETANDAASTESAMIEFANQARFDNIALIQATSPLLCGEDLDRGFAMMGGMADSVVSCVRQKRFIWNEDAAGFGHPSNYNLHQRPRRQEFEGFLMENGAFYITSREALLRTGCRCSGRVKLCLMDDVSSYEIDEPYDWVVAESLLKTRN